MSAKTDYSIQYLRGIAASLVILAHFDQIILLKHFSGALGVDIFFIISGYIMRLTAPKYADRKKVFVVNRIIRIYPLYIAISLPLFAFLASHGQWSYLAKSIFFIGGNYLEYNDPILFTGWSLFYEMVFYALVITTVRKPVWTTIILFAMGISGLIFQVNTIWGYVVNPYFLLFMVGFNLQTLEKIRSPINHVTLNFIMSCVVLGAVMLFYDHDPVVEMDQYVPRQFIYVFDVPIPRFLFWGLPSLYFVISFRKFIRTRKISFLKELGDISYSIYLVHTLLYLTWEYLRPRVSTDYHLVIYTVLLFLIYPVSKLTYQLIEVGVSRKLKQWLR